MTTQTRHWISWLLLALFFFAHYFVRIAPPLMAIELMKDFSISIGQMGLISGLYFLTYTLAQIPVGYLIKNYSQKFLLGSASLTCALLAVAFSYSSHFSQEVLFVIGSMKFSSAFLFALFSLSCYAFFGAFGFVGSISYASQNLPQYQSFLVGATQSLGMAAGFIATNWIVAQLADHTWQTIIQKSAMGLAVLGIVIFAFVSSSTVQNNKPTSETKTSSKSASQGPKKSIFSDPQTWTNSMYAGFIYVPLMIFTEGGLGPSMLASIHHHSREEIAFAISMIFMAWMIGGPVAGLFADRYGRTRVMRFSAVAGFITAGLALFYPMSSGVLSFCLFMFGITNTGIVGCYSIAADMHGPENASISLAISNMATILVGTVLGSILPTLLEITSSPIFVEGVPLYSAMDYQRIFGATILTVPVLAYICASLTKETPISQ